MGLPAWHCRRRNCRRSRPGLAAPPSSSAMPVRCCAKSRQAAPGPATAMPTGTVRWCGSTPPSCFRKPLDAGAATLVPFAPRGADAGAAGGADASADTAAPWSGDLLHADEVFVTGVGASTTYPDYKPAPFIVGSRVQGVDMVTVVTEGIFSYCSFKVKIDTDRFLGPDQAPVRCQGEAVGHVTTAEYGSQMLSLGGVQHLTGGSRKEGRITAELMQRLGNKQAVELGIDAGAQLLLQAGPRTHRQRRGRATHAGGLRLCRDRYLCAPVLRPCR